MLTGFFLLVVGSIFGTIFSIFPSVTSLPFSLDAFLITSVGQLYAFIGVFWPLQPVWDCVLFYVPIKAGLLVLRVFLGSRVPDAA